MRTLWRFIAGFFKWTWRLLNFVCEMVPVSYTHLTLPTT